MSVIKHCLQLMALLVIQRVCFIGEFTKIHLPIHVHLRQSGIGSWVKQGTHRGLDDGTVYPSVILRGSLKYILL